MRPYYLIEERLLRRNLSLIRSIAEEAGVEIILAFKAYALWKTFPIFREYIQHTTASSPWEARLAFEEFGSKAHTYSPAYEEDTFEDIVACSSHISFNSLAQWERFGVKAIEKGVKCGLRINPEHSAIETEIYNPCAPGSRFGVLAPKLPEQLPMGITGLHCHCHCESSSYELEDTLKALEEKFGSWLNQIEWLNLGGGHLVSRKDYDVKHLVGLLQAFRQRYPHLKVILEPGSAFGWQTGPLVSEVVDVVENHGIKTAILNVSFACHMPDCLEMPYLPQVRGAKSLPLPQYGGEENIETSEGFVYRLGGNSCLSGDWMGNWSFNTPLKIGDKVIFEDMNHYTTVKTCMFNGIEHPAIVMEREDGTREVLREFCYEDYRSRMD